MVVAPSGKGKTSLFSFIYGERSDFSGTITMDGERIDWLELGDWAKIRRSRIGCVFQDLKLFDGFSVRENIELKNRLTEHKSADEIRECLAMLQMEELQNRAVDKLSTGQKQRVALIRAICQPFEILLLDEPFSHLDPENTNRAFELIEAELKARNAGLILSSLTGQEKMSFDRTFQL